MNFRRKEATPSHARVYSVSDRPTVHHPPSTKPVAVFVVRCDLFTLGILVNLFQNRFSLPLYLLSVAHHCYITKNVALPVLYLHFYAIILDHACGLSVSIIFFN
jgi:hypothetical protein